MLGLLLMGLVDEVIFYTSTSYWWICCLISVSQDCFSSLSLSSVEVRKIGKVKDRKSVV